MVFITCGAVVPLQEWRLDRQYVHFVLLVITPLLVCVTLVSSRLSRRKSRNTKFLTISVLCLIVQILSYEVGGFLDVPISSESAKLTYTPATAHPDLYAHSQTLGLHTTRNDRNSFKFLLIPYAERENTS